MSKCLHKRQKERAKERNTNNSHYTDNDRDKYRKNQISTARQAGRRAEMRKYINWQQRKTEQNKATKKYTQTTHKHIINT